MSTAPSHPRFLCLLPDQMSVIGIPQKSVSPLAGEQCKQQGHPKDKHRALQERRVLGKGHFPRTEGSPELLQCFSRRPGCTPETQAQGTG